jgi:PemK-like, MazF-like toxin of type II toxin-antitoxin system
MIRRQRTGRNPVIVTAGYCGGMGLLADLMKSVSDAVTGGRRRGRAPSRKAGRSGGRRSASTPAPRSSSSSPVATAPGHPPRADAEILPGEVGPDATVEVDPHRIGPVRTSYSPQTDGAPDPGEIVWTWVPFEENDGRGKDRPVLVVAVESAGTYLAVQLTSKDHDGEGDFVSIGAGGWDGERRPSWVNLDRVIRVHEGGMRREAAALPREPFERVTDRLHQRYGWR